MAMMGGGQKRNEYDTRNPYEGLDIEFEGGRGSTKMSGKQSR